MKFAKFFPVVFLLIFSALLSPAGASVKLSPADEGVYHAAHPDFGLRDDFATPDIIRDFESLSHKKIVWSYFSWHWENEIKFPSEMCRTLNDEGVIPLVGIMPWSTLKQGAPEPVYTLERLLNGDFDEDIAQCAEEAHDLGFPIMIEFGPEVNGSWFPWNGAWNGRDATGYGDRALPDGPERFRDAYRKIIGIFRKQGAMDVTWVFHIAASGSPKEAWNSASYYYPGDDWIDWIGASVYGRLGDDRLTSFSDIMKRIYPGICALSATKPLAVLEMGVTDGDDKALWIKEAFAAINSGAYPRINAVSWWNKTHKQDGTRSTLEIDSSPESLKSYREGVKNFLAEAVWSEN
jgi:hypothetical protein